MFSELTFSTPPKTFDLIPQVIYLWHIPHHIPEQQDWELCSNIEQTRGQRYLLEKSRQQFIYYRASLRRILSQYLNINAVDLNIQIAQNGKPFVLNQTGEMALQFNLSHSGKNAILAVSKTVKCGVDIEQLKLSPQWQNIAQRMFSEKACLKLNQETNNQQRTILFIRYWTRLEACQKCHGAGILKDHLDIDLMKIKTFALLPSHLISLAWYKDQTKITDIIAYQYFRHDLFNVRGR